MGIILSVAVAFMDAFNNTFIKKGVSKFSLLTVTWVWQVFSLIILVPAILITGMPQLLPAFWWSSISKVLVQVAALLLYASALKTAEISLAVPMLAFTPLVTMGTSFLLNGDKPSPLAICGVVLIILGAYLLNFSGSRKGIFTPFKVMFENKGVLYMFVVAVLWGITSTLDRTAVINSSPVFYSFFVAGTIGVILTPAVISGYRKEFTKVFMSKNIGKLLPIGLLHGITEITQMTAVGLTLATYVIAIKRSSIIISSIFGWLMFKEDLKRRTLPIFMMFLGILLIALFK